jgi:8-oxo-dGTP pyrophosphatase MutT (NUDIX family)
MEKTYIDKLAFIEIQKRRLLVTLSKGKDTWYIPGGKREGNESDAEALTREVREELSVEIDPTTMTQYGIFEAQAHGKPIGTVVRMTCYSALYSGELTASSEIDRIDWFSFADVEKTSPVDHLIFRDLKDKKLID